MALEESCSTEYDSIFHTLLLLCFLVCHKDLQYLPKVPGTLSKNYEKL